MEFEERLELLEQKINALIENHDKSYKLEKLEFIVERIKHEDELISKRLTWMTTIHGFLFSSLGFSIGKFLSFWFFATIGGTGILISISTWLALDRAMTAIDSYDSTWTNLGEQIEPLFKNAVGYKEEDAVRKFFSPPNFLPILFGSTWLFIVVLASSGNLDPTMGKSSPSMITPSPTPQSLPQKSQSSPTPIVSPPQAKSKNQVPASQKAPLQTP